MRDNGTVTGSIDFRLEEDRPRAGTVVVSVHGDLDLHTADELGDRLVVPAPQISRLFEITALDRVFPLDETREQALARGERLEESDDAVSEGHEEGTTGP